MMGSKPRLDLDVNGFGQRADLVHISVGRDPGVVVLHHVPAFAEGIEPANRRRAGTHGKDQALERPMVTIAAPRHAIATGYQSDFGRLERGIVGDVEAPVSAEVGGLAVVQVAPNERQQVADLLPACRVRRQPAVAFPVGQGHRHLRSRTAGARRAPV